METYNKNIKKWNDVWKMGRIRIMLNKIKGKYNFIFYKKLLKNTLIRNPNILELGCGMGVLSENLIEKYGGDATLVDYSNESMKLVEKTFKYPYRFVKSDIFNLKNKKKFNIVHSQGLLEHYDFKKQVKLLKIHKNLVKRGGYIIIFIPRMSFIYRIMNKIWSHEDLYESPMTIELMKRLTNCVGLKIINIVKTPEQLGFLIQK